MAPKHQLDKAAWLWAETVEPENISKENIETAFRVNFKPCKEGICRRNCKGNPRCIYGLGEREWMGEIDDKYWHDIEDPAGERRAEGSFVGLKNLGATCYVNTLLQVWFHNTHFRSAIYQWIDPEEKPICQFKSGEQCKSSTENGENSSFDEKPADLGEKCHNTTQTSVDEVTEWTPKCIAGHLQLIFGLLQFSERRYIDPSAFIDFLGLDAAQQQDAQEFSKLFISLLEDTLSLQSIPRVRNLVQDQFSGQYAYVTECSKCVFGSEHTSTFYELDLSIQGNRDLNQCVEEFLQEEKLEGDNKYMCAQCNSKQNATRRIQLRSLPPVLNLQLLRFVFDRNTGHKKKLNTYIQFPENLDMSKYVDGGHCTTSSEDGSKVDYLYDLVAVLIHRGPSAYSGHYIAHIKDRKSETWYKFNDEEIEKMAGKNLQLGNEDDLEGGKKNIKKPRMMKGYHASRNAYMLVYHRKTLQQTEEVEEEQINVATIPERLQQYVISDNVKFEEWISEMTAMQDRNVINGKSKQNEIIQMYKMFPVKDDGEYEWIMTSWISKWLGEDNKVPPVDNSDMLCQHNMLKPDAAEKMKCISVEAADIIYPKYGGSPRVNSSMLCHKCVEERCRVIRTKARLEEDNKFISTALKLKPHQGENTYWVGKRSLRSWKRLVLQGLGETPHANGTGDSHNVSSDATAFATSTTPPNTPSALSSYAVTSTPVSDTLPNNATTKTESSCATSKSEPSPTATTPTELTPSRRARASTTESLENEDELLGFNEDLLCEHNNLTFEENLRRLVPTDVWLRLRKYFPQATEFTADDDVCTLCIKQTQEEIRCKHRHKQLASEVKQKLSDLYLDRHRPRWSKQNCQLNVVSTDFLDEWRKFIRDPLKKDPVTHLNNSTLLCPHGGFMFEPEVIGHTESNIMMALVTPDEWTELRNILTTDVEILISRVEEENGQVTFVVSPDVCRDCSIAREQQELAEKSTFTNTKIYIRKLTLDKTVLSSVASQGSNSSAEDSDKDPEFMQINDKKKKETVIDKVGKVENSNVRRSTRTRHVRGEKDVTVSSSDSLRSLKLKIMKLFSVAPFDQHLMLDGRNLTGDQSTLGSLHITPGCVLLLKVDEPCEDPMLIEDLSKASYPEEGFKGTSLLGGK